MKNLIIIVFAVLLLSSCKKKDDDVEIPTCDLPEQTVGSGEIIQNALVDAINPDSFSTGNGGDIIRSDSENVYNLMVSYDQGVSYDSIDFDQYTVLGKSASGTCTAVFDRHVSRDTVAKKCTYRIKVYECGLCLRLWPDANLVLVPRIPEDYTVDFIVE